MRTASQQLWQGFSSPIKGGKMILSSPSLFFLAITPTVLSGTFLVLAVINGVKQIGPIIAKLASYFGFANLTGFFGTLAYWFLYSTFFVALFCFVVFLGYLIAVVLASPFSSLLAERSLALQNAIDNRPFSLGSWVILSLRMLKAAVVKTLVFLIIGLVLFVFSLIPVVNVFASLCFLLIMAFDHADYSFENLGYSFSARIGFFRTHFFKFLGLALALGLVLLVPGLNLIIFPVSVVAASVIIADTLGKVRA